MGQIKERINKFEKNRKPWARVVKWILGIIATLLLVGFFLTQTPTPEQEKVIPPKYEVVVSNSIGHRTYYCETYLKVDNTYKLYDSEDNLTNEISITNGYLIEIKLSQ